MAELKAENEKLLQMLGFSDADSGIVSQRADELQDASTEHFIAALGQPENRVLDDEALTSLRELFQS